MQCTSCGKQCDETKAFCPHCGAAVQLGYSQQPTQEQSMYSQQSAQEQAGNSQQTAQEQQSNSQYSQSQYGQNTSSYGQSQYGQNTSSYGQSQYGQNTSPYGQSRYGQNTSPYGHSPYQQGRPAYMNNNPTVTSQRSHSKPCPGYAGDYPMAWFKFLIYFMLFANAAINIFTAVTYLTGSVYLGEDMTMSDVEALYMFYPTAKMIDVIYGVLLIALAAYAIFTRFQLSGFKRRGPFLFILMYVLNLVIGLLYGISIMFTFETGLLGFISFVPSIITSVVMIFVNVVYFRKREELFVY
ncbi:MAG: hypothetical protein ACLTMM_09005 [Lachnospiraceae bacterium]